MGKYTQDQLDAYKDILEAGTEATISRVVSEYDAVTEEETITLVATDDCAVVSFPASSGTGQAFDNRIIEDYKKGKIRFFYVAGLGFSFEPEAGDLLFFNGKVWEIAGTTPLAPDGTDVILYTMGVRVSNLDVEGAFGSDFNMLYEEYGSIEKAQAVLEQFEQLANEDLPGSLPG